MTESEKRKLEPSSCTKIPKRGHESPNPLRWEGMNSRYEQDAVTHGPTGHQPAKGFHMLDPDYEGE